MSTLLDSVFASGGRVSQYSEFAIVTLHGCSFATTAAELDRQQGWARDRASSGDPARDCAQFVEHFGIVIGRDGSGIASKGSPMELRRIIKAMTAASIFMEGWATPRNGADSLPPLESPT